MLSDSVAVPVVRWTGASAHRTVSHRSPERGWLDSAHPKNDVGLRLGILSFRRKSARLPLSVSVLEQIVAEEAQASLGGSYVVGRLLDVLFIQAIRTWASSEGNMPEGWLAGLTHRQLAQTLHRIHADLAHPWTLEQLARDAGSRAPPSLRCSSRSSEFRR